MFSDAWKNILDDINSFSNDSYVWFRGVSRTSHLLKSGLFRLDPPTNDIKEFVNVEKQLFRHYKNLGHLLHNNDDGWNLLYSMQHHGVRTRLLDWSESFAVALFFATDGWKTGEARIWMLKPMELNEKSVNKKEIISPTKIDYLNDYCEDTTKKTNSIALYPIKNNSRIIAQHGFFTVQGNTLDPLNCEFDGTLERQEILSYIDLKIEVRQDALRFLNINGINKFSLFPDLVGLSSYVNETNIPSGWLPY